MMARRNAHATCVVIGSRGVMIRGRSGAGKTALALALLEACRARTRFAKFVADDQVWLEVCNGQLLAEAPETIAGLVEVFGFGPRTTDFEARAVIDLIVDLVEPGGAARYQDENDCLIEGVRVRHLVVPERQVLSSVQIVLSRLDISSSA